MTTRQTVDRRTFLHSLGTVSTAAAATTVVASTPAHAYDPGQQETRGRYRETEHVKAFYRTNGYETLKK